MIIELTTNQAYITGFLIVFLIIMVVLARLKEKRLHNKDMNECCAVNVDQQEQIRILHNKIIMKDNLIDSLSDDIKVLSGGKIT